MSVKRCTICGCLMGKDHDGDICECCQDDREEVQDERDKQRREKKRV